MTENLTFKPIIYIENMRNITKNPSISLNFSALPGGYGGSDGSFLNVGLVGYWWSASEDDAYYAYLRLMFYSAREYASWDIYNKSGLFSVRCVED